MIAWQTCWHPTTRAGATEMRLQLISLPIGQNPLLLSGIAVELAMIMASCYTPFGNSIFGTAPLEWEAWVIPIPFAIAMLGADEARKRLNQPQPRS